MNEETVLLCKMHSKVYSFELCQLRYGVGWYKNLMEVLMENVESSSGTIYLVSTGLQKK